MSSTAFTLNEPIPVPTARRALERPRQRAANPNTRRDGDPRGVPYRDGGDCRPLRWRRHHDRRPQSGRRGYPSDLTDSQWQRLQPLLLPNTHAARARAADVRAILNAINYRWRCGCTWRMLPHDFPPWETVYGHYRNWRKAGMLPVIRDALLRRHALESDRQPEVETR